MANVNKLILIGRLTRDPETRTFANGGKVAKFGFAVTNRKKNSQTGQWEDVPMFIDCEAYNRGEFGKQADLVEQYLAKGRQVYLEGRQEEGAEGGAVSRAPRANGPAPARPAAKPAVHADDSFADEPDAAGGG